VHRTRDSLLFLQPAVPVRRTSVNRLPRYAAWSALQNLTAVFAGDRPPSAPLFITAMSGRVCVQGPTVRVSRCRWTDRIVVTTRARSCRHHARSNLAADSAPVAGLPIAGKCSSYAKSQSQLGSAAHRHRACHGFTTSWTFTTLEADHRLVSACSRLRHPKPHRMPVTIRDQAARNSGPWGLSVPQCRSRR